MTTRRKKSAAADSVPFPAPDEVWPALRQWFLERGYSPFPYQEQTWDARRAGHGGLLHMPTGAGKTYAAYLGALSLVAEERARGTKAALRLIYITPLRALSRDVEKALRRPVDDLRWPLAVGSRTGDTPSSQRARQREKPPDVLVTTPESLALLLSYPTAAHDFASLQTIIVDEWHELLATKRGSLLELTLARARAIAPAARTWAVSATLANVDEALAAALGGSATADDRIVAHAMDRPLRIDTLLPDYIDGFPWAGHLGSFMVPKLVEDLDIARPTLVFTNTRFQAERWYQLLSEARPDWAPLMALHHGSLDRDERERVESGIKEGSLRLVVCTSSLDLGVDLSAVERVYQIGSPKGLGRLVQRAGRSAHRPLETCRLTFVPTHALELLEIAACRDALAEGRMEPRHPLAKPLDVLAQHLVSSALGGGFAREEILSEVRTAHSFRTLSESELDDVLLLVEQGGKALHAYPQFRRIRRDGGHFVGADDFVARRHRLNIGTITSDASVLVKFAGGGRIGTIDESFISRVRRGDRFLFAGRTLEMVRLRDMVAEVRLAKGRETSTPHWGGTKLPLTESLASAVRRELARLAEGIPPVAELQRLAPIVDEQRRLSMIPRAEEVLVEICTTREGTHAFFFPFEGRLVHEGLAALLAFRLAKTRSATFALSANDYGFEMLAAGNFPFEELLQPELFRADSLTEDIVGSLNLGELARRQFRDVARIAGLTFQNVPGLRKNARQLQASSGLLYDVLTRYEPENPLLGQARREVLEATLEHRRLASALERLAGRERVLRYTEHPTPLAFPLLVARIGARLSTESLLERIDRLKSAWTAPPRRKKSQRKKAPPLPQETI